MKASEIVRSPLEARSAAWVLKSPLDPCFLLEVGVSPFLVLLIELIVCVGVLACRRLFVICVVSGAQWNVVLLEGDLYLPR